MNSEPRRDRRRSSAASVALLVVLVGCGGEAVPKGGVEGTITLGSKPLATPAEIVFLGTATGDSAKGTVGSDGTFQLAYPLKAGEYRVFLTPPAAPTTGEPVPVKADPGLPRTFTNEADTPLTADVESGSNAFRIDLDAASITREDS